MDQASLATQLKSCDWERYLQDNPDTQPLLEQILLEADYVKDFLRRFTVTDLAAGLVDEPWELTTTEWEGHIAEFPDTRALIEQILYHPKATRETLRRLREIDG
jgi:hypothetical protein